MASEAHKVKDERYLCGNRVADQDLASVYPKNGVRSALSSTNHNGLLVQHRARVSHAVELWMRRVLPRILLAVHNSASRLSGAIEPRAERQGHDGPWMRHV